jgi:hypothetical protein
MCAEQIIAPLHDGHAFMIWSSTINIWQSWKERRNVVIIEGNLENRFWEVSDPWPETMK